MNSRGCGERAQTSLGEERDACLLVFPEQAGLRGLSEGQAVSYELEQDRRSGKTSATNLRVVG